MRHVSIALGTALLTLASAFGADVDVGAINQKPPQPQELAAPKTDKGIATVDLHESVKGKVAKNEKRPLYIVINPLSNSETKNTWWVQQEVARDGESFSAAAQFGEEDGGKGEFFAILAVATDKKWSVGDRLNALPEDAAYTKVKIVKRQ